MAPAGRSRSAASASLHPQSAATSERSRPAASGWAFDQVTITRLACIMRCGFSTVEPATYG